MNQADLDGMLERTGKGIRNTTSVSASGSDDLPLSKRSQTGRNYIEIQGAPAHEGPESELQARCEAYLERRNIAFIRIPDSLYRWIFGQKVVSAPIRQLISKYLTGVPDLVVLLPNGRYLCAELKTRKGKLTQGQKKFSRNVSIEVFRSYETFTQRTEELLA